MPQTFYEIVWIFIIYAVIGWFSEVAYAALERGVFINRGFLNGPYCPIYGIGVLVVVVTLTPLKKNLIILYVGSVFLTSVLEFITGFVMEKIFHNKWWDYSDKPFNIMGYVCLKFSVLWGFACTFIMLVIHPLVYGFIRVIPRILGTALMYIFMICFFADLIVTVSTIVKFNRRLRLMNEIAGRLKLISNDIGENVYENVMEALEIKEDLEKERRNLKKRYQELIEKKSPIENRLLKAFPGIKSKENDEILQKIKNRIQEKRRRNDKNS